MAQNVIS